jgi:hypothetical protein
VTGSNQEVFVLRGLGQRELQTLSNSEGVPKLGLGTVVRKDPLIPIPPARNWGQGPVIESVLPQGGLVKAALKGILWDSAAMNS